MDRIRLVHTDTLSCEAILRIAPNGELLIISQCKDVCEPAPGNRVFAFHSKDGGESWISSGSVVPENGRAQYSTEAAVVGDEIILFMTEHDGNFTAFKSYLAVSKDNGYTFEKREFSPIRGFCFYRGVLPFRGKYLLPYQQYPVTEEQDRELQAKGLKIWNAALGGVRMGTLSTEDFRSFTPSERDAVLPLSDGGVRRWVWSEPTLAPLSDGRIAMLLRFDGRGFLYRSISEDCGRTWSEPEKTDIPNPGNKPKLIPLSGGRIALLNTPQSGSGYLNRQPLSLWISGDDMKSWNYKRDIVTFPGWLSYPDGVVSADGKRILFAFELNRHDIYFVDAEI